MKIVTQIRLHPTWVGQPNSAEASPLGTLVICPSRLFSFSFLEDFIYLFLERGEGREEEKPPSAVASHTPPAGTWCANQACALTRNQTGDFLVCRPALNPLSHTSQGRAFS